MFKQIMKKKLLPMAVISSLVVGGIGTTTVSQVEASTHKNNQSEIKNVIFMVGDGMGPAYTTMLRYMNDNPETKMMEPTAFDEYLVGMQSTYSWDPYFDGGEGDVKENIPDSAATATSMASGIKTYNGAIGLDLDQEEHKTILEEAKEQGKATGLVSTSQINHATPAAFGAHDASRNNYNAIADDYFDETIDGEHKVDVMLGGGTSYFEREDRNLVEAFQEDGYDYATTKEEMLASDNDQLLGLFAPKGMDKAIDRGEDSPSLSEMTTTALDKVSEDKDGFFLMVEGSQIDWAGHDNDVVAAMSEMREFEKAFQEAIEFAKKDKETIVVTTADHSTGGIAIGRGGDYVFNPEVIDAAERTPDYMAAQIADGADVEQVLNDYSGLNLTEKEIQSVQEAAQPVNGTIDETAVDDAIENIYNVRSGTGWTTGGHTGVDVNVYAYGPQKGEFSGLNENSETGQKLFELLKADRKGPQSHKDNDHKGKDRNHNK
ncbi:alkaline phosphatase [Halobacillus karajensis]|uniref:Alkaline phosphatase 3 n=1 Tax=Halobacillus karajensis TaxID=195088 RepID=A0A059NYS5_9BACI|nr:alkaline phosphatase [Halobacillus karajensis]CDQ18527.1 Alkaline phosphatase 3 precursor [Halobacillus karajensis]CDQ23401.1 Alkaline phosphatase 3 precursor [Halobacillus karajensis]CDQ26883.1 Alkaline phosphatase 3 precursor [Halobacillus karajensis]SEH50349.1 alkaline phosphatase [Halobacillus karajensis]